MGKREQKVQNSVAIKNDTTKYYARLETGTFGICSVNYTFRPVPHGERMCLIRTYNTLSPKRNDT